jgi:1-acyl-sn-glycerol-3-phosphate acyltransferase
MLIKLILFASAGTFMKSTLLASAGTLWKSLLFIAAGSIALVVAFVVFYAAIPILVRPFWRAVLFPHYRFRLVGVEKIPSEGPFVLASNHVSWIDGFILAAVCPRRIWFLSNADYTRSKLVNMLARRARLIPVPAKGPRAHREAIAAARGELDMGRAFGIFPEAQLTRDGRLGTFLRGIEMILRDRDHVPVIPVYIENMWGSIFSYSAGKFLGRLPETFRREVVVVFGDHAFAPISTFTIRREVAAAAVVALENRSSPPRSLEAIAKATDLTRWSHPEFGLLAVSTADFDDGIVRQLGMKPGSVGREAPGVALFVVADDGTLLEADRVGRIEARIVGRPNRVNTRRRGRIDREGFVYLEE